MFGLVYECVDDKNMVGSPAARGECPLEWVGYVGIGHKLH